MSLKLQELHPTLVHFPIALMPMAIGADLLARLTGSRRLAEVGRLLMPAAAVGAAVSAAAGLVAAVEVKAEGKAGDILVTHRNMNLSLTAVTALMAAWRLREEEAGAGYLALGLAGLGAMSYSAYLGGKMVYEHGVGVKPADGLRDGDAPELAPGQMGAAVRRAGSDLARSITPVVDDVKAGRFAPSFGQDLENRANLTPGGGPGASAAGNGAGDGAGSPEAIP